MSDDEVVLSVKGLEKTFRIGFFRKKVEAVRGIDFEVRKGEIFGLLGPNGAGKTTTIKVLLRLIYADAGTVEIFGEPKPSVRSMARIGYLPENPYVYQYLRPLEFLDLCGRLVGMPAEKRKSRSEAMLDEVGLAHAADRPIGKFSKGMMQRIGLAQALLHEPELLILDEPMSGLDPIGRKDVRELILAQRDRGRTILFTSHILSDVELLCDRVGIMQFGQMRHYGVLRDLLADDRHLVEVDLGDVSDELRGELEEMGHALRELGDGLVVIIEGGDGPGPVVARALEAGATLRSVTPSRETLEDVFVRDDARSPPA